jgi:hypothetical protein
LRELRVGPPLERGRPDTGRNDEQHERGDDQPVDHERRVGAPPDECEREDDRDQAARSRGEHADDERPFPCGCLLGVTLMRGNILNWDEFSNRSKRVGARQLLPGGGADARHLPAGRRPAGDEQPDYGHPNGFGVHAYDYGLGCGSCRHGRRIALRRHRHRRQRLGTRGHRRLRRRRRQQHRHGLALGLQRPVLREPDELPYRLLPGSPRIDGGDGAWLYAPTSAAERDRTVSASTREPTSAKPFGRRLPLAGPLGTTPRHDGSRHTG